ncbi:MAG: hypothetical protein JPMHGGIA_02843 [Saprospiraceae bacterium]|jgi:Fic family protein|nr:hypothetical protein [Saprospiraceae bacterium]
MKNDRQKEVFGVILKHQPIGVSDIISLLTEKVSVPTLNRDLAALKKDQFIYSQGKGPSVKYLIHMNGLLFAPIDINQYYELEIDQRPILEKFNPAIFDSLKTTSLFSSNELEKLAECSSSFQKKMTTQTPGTIQKENERWMIELSWKSSQIEGNTYDLIDTEQLLKYNISSAKHSEQERIMLLNHKSAITFIRENAKDYIGISIGKIMEIHSLLTLNLGVEKSLRNRLVRITGTRYTPLDIPLLIQENLEKMCELINDKENVYEKALLAVILISYLQPFEDGNKRTARLTANAVLMAYDLCPLSYRSVSPSDYKKAMLLFYELNHIKAFKNLWIDQYIFATEHYFG